MSLFKDTARHSLEQNLELGKVDYEQVSQRTRERIENRHQEAREKAQDRSERTILVLQGIGKAIPIIRPLTRNLTRYMMKKKAKDLFERYMAAEGYQKWIFGIGAALAFAGSFVMPEAVPFIIAGVFGAEAALKKYEESLVDGD